MAASLRLCGGVTTTCGYLRATMASWQFATAGWPRDTRYARWKPAVWSIRRSGARAKSTCSARAASAPRSSFTTFGGRASPCIASRRMWHRALRDARRSTSFGFRLQVEPEALKPNRNLSFAAPHPGDLFDVPAFFPFRKLPPGLGQRIGVNNDVRRIDGPDPQPRARRLRHNCHGHFSRSFRGGQSLSA